MPLHLGQTNVHHSLKRWKGVRDSARHSRIFKLCAMSDERPLIYIPVVYLDAVFSVIYGVLVSCTGEVTTFLRKTLST